MSQAEIPGWTTFWPIIIGVLNKFQDSNNAGYQRCMGRRRAKDGES